MVHVVAEPVYGRLWESPYTPGFFPIWQLSVPEIQPFIVYGSPKYCFLLKKKLNVLFAFLFIHPLIEQISSESK